MATTEHKLLDAYYEGTAYDGELLANGKIETDGNFKMNDDIELGDVHSIKWYGYVKAPEAGTYKLSISPDQQTKIQIGGQIVLDGSKAVSFKLEKGKVYPIRIESTAVKEFTLKWSINGSGMQTLSKDVFLLPLSNEKMPKGAMSG
ncbi:TPA: hypothetical protein ROY17_005933, partial [Bacillus thuringiensis]|nr:hypothetical protein [Bacillus thuringiensis]